MRHHATSQRVYRASPEVAPAPVRREAPKPPPKSSPSKAQAETPKPKPPTVAQLQKIRLGQIEARVVDAVWAIATKLGADYDSAQVQAATEEALRERELIGPKAKPGKGPRRQTIYLPQPLSAAIRERAKATGWGRDRVIRELLAEALGVSADLSA